MLKAPIYADELQRLEALLQYNILDTPREQIFDDITFLASYICGKPVAFLSLVDKERQWFKSVIGSEASETPRDISFCGHAIHAKEIFIIENALLDERFKDNPLVTGPLNVQFYAGVPLTAPSGYNIGTLCVVDHKPGRLTEDQIKSLIALKRQVMAFFELRKQIKDISANSEIINKQSTLILKNEKQALESSRHNSVTQMASGLAHEINNPLSIITLKMSLLNKYLEKGDGNSASAKECIQKVIETTKRITHIVASFVDLSRKNTAEPFVKYNLKTIIDESIYLCAEKTKINKVNVSVNLDENIFIECRSVQISQCFVNLINNSIDSIEALTERWIKIEGKTVQDNIEITLTDSGTGIKDTHILNHLMEPFNTSKPIGKGMGLGLSITKSLIEVHKGEISYDSSYPHTRFILKLPILQNKV